MAYALLGIAIICELIGTTLVKQSLGFTRLIPTIGCLLAYFMSFFLFSKALNSINLGAAYATWSAVGISEWGSCNFMHSRGEVKSFLKSSVNYWLSEYHFDGIRMDANQCKDLAKSINEEFGKPLPASM